MRRSHGRGAASAADKLSVGVGGYMQQWFGMSSVEDTANPATEGGVAQQSDSEIFFKGKLEADNGLTFSVKVEIEGNSPSAVDESQLTVSGEFGAITLGAEDSSVVLTHHGVRDAGFGMLCGDFAKWINGIKGCGPGGMGTAGHGLGDKNNVTYFSPRINGVHFGVTYIPNIAQEGSAAPLTGDEDDAWSVGGNYRAISAAPMSRPRSATTRGPPTTTTPMSASRSAWARSASMSPLRCRTTARTTEPTPTWWPPA